MDCLTHKSVEKFILKNKEKARQCLPSGQLLMPGETLRNEKPEGVEVVGCQILHNSTWNNGKLLSKQEDYTLLALYCLVPIQ